MLSEPFLIFQIYHAVLLHFSTDYNYQQYNGATSYKQETFERRKDKYAFHKMVRLFEDTYTLKEIEYYFAWMFMRSNKWVTTRDISNITMLSFETDWRNYSIARMTYFQCDMDRIKNVGGMAAQQLFNLTFNGEIHTATLLILDRVKGTLATMDSVLKGQYLWDQHYKKLRKFAGFYYAHEPIQEIEFRQHIPENMICPEI